MGPEGAIVRFLKREAQDCARLCKRQSRTGQKAKKDHKEREEGVACHVGYAAGRDR